MTDTRDLVSLRAALTALRERVEKLEDAADRANPPKVHLASCIGKMYPGTCNCGAWQ